MKVGTLTFHGSHNYGSVLQAYALQKVLDDIVGEGEHEIVNLRKEEQKKYYSVYDSNKTLKSFISNIYRFWHRKELKEKFIKFEDFINNEMPLSRELSNKEQVSDEITKYNSVICGSDQIWNMDSFDFDETYLLPFKVDNKVSYSASFGGNTDVIKNNRDSISKYINDFNHISVRESSSKKELEKIVNKKIEQVADPTLLLDVKEWNSLIQDTTVGYEDYILFYSLGPSKEDIELVTNISKKLGYQIIVTNTANRHDKKMKAIKDLSMGPKDFLALIKNAKLVCTSSFHCTVFSILFKKQFWCINVENEKRLQSLLETSKLKSRNINNNNYIKKIEEIINESEFESAQAVLNEEKKKGLDFLKGALLDNDNMR